MQFTLPPVSSPLQKKRMFSDNSGPYTYAERAGSLQTPLRPGPVTFATRAGALYGTAYNNVRTLPGKRDVRGYFGSTKKHIVATNTAPLQQVYPSRVPTGDVSLFGMNVSLTMLAGAGVLAYFLFKR